jgi:hypothetical protein
MAGTAAGFLEKFHKVKRTISRVFRRQIFSPSNSLNLTPGAGVSVISNSLESSPIIEGFFLFTYVNDTGNKHLHFQQKEFL